MNDELKQLKENAKAFLDELEQDTILIRDRLDFDEIERAYRAARRAKGSADFVVQFLRAAVYCPKEEE